jgi:hypothetical protein
VTKKKLAPLRSVVKRKQTATRNNTSIAGTLFLECGHRVRVTGWDAFHAESKRCKECLEADTAAGD